MGHVRSMADPKQAMPDITRGGRHQEPHPFLALLHDVADREGACRKNQFWKSDVA